MVQKLKFFNRLSLSQVGETTRPLPTQNENIHLYSSFGFMIEHLFQEFKFISYIPTEI